MLCVIAKIDETARKRLAQLQISAEEEFGIPPRHLHGHITFLTCVGADEDKVIGNCRRILERERAFSVRYEAIEVLSATNIIVATPTKTRALSELHGRLAEACVEYLTEWTKTDRWLAHTTLLHDPNADLEKIARVMRAHFETVEARIERFEFSRVTDGGFEIVGDAALMPETDIG